MRVVLTKTVKIAGRFRPPGYVVELSDDQMDLVPAHATPVGETDDGEAYDPETGEILDTDTTEDPTVDPQPVQQPAKSRRRR